MNLYLFIAIINLSTVQSLDAQEFSDSSSHLAHYNAAGSSSSFGEPIFRLEPPSSITFSSSRGATILCLASGSPQPTISWYSSWSAIDIGHTGSSTSGGESTSLQQTRPISNVTNLLQIMQNGAAIRLLPFKETDFRQEIHSTEYKCVASNYLATIHSRSVLVQAVLSEESNGNQQTPPEQVAKVNDEFVELGSLAVLKCRPSNNADFHYLIEWFTSDNLQIRVGETIQVTPANAKGASSSSRSSNSKFTAFRSGELHVNEVDMGDLQRSYGCRLKNTVTGRIVSSSGAAQLILTSNAGAGPLPDPAGPQVVHSVSQLIADDSSAKRRSLQLLLQQWPNGGRGFSQVDLLAQSDQPDWRLLVPCALKNPPPAGHSIRWLYQPTSQQQQSVLELARPGSQERAVPLSDWAAARSIPVISVVQPDQLDSANSSRRLPIKLTSGAEHKQQQFAQRYLAGQSYLAIEWPTSAQSGRYICQLLAPLGGGDLSSSRTLCDTNVIIRRPIELSVELAQPVSPLGMEALGLDSYPSSARLGFEESQESLLDRAATWFGLRHRRSSDRFRRVSGQVGRPQSLLDSEPARVQVRGQGSIEAPPVVQVGQQLKLHCRGRGHPIELIRWFRNGQFINTQSSNDFQVQITTNTSQREEQRDDKELFHSDERVLSSLLVRHLQPKDAGLTMFECFAQNSHGDRARAGKVVLVLERPALDWARSLCPISPDAATGRPQMEAFLGGSANDADEWDPQSLVQGDSRGASIFRRHNPMLRALVLEAEPVELLCPAAEPLAANDSAYLKWPVEWRRWKPSSRSAGQLAGSSGADPSGKQTALAEQASSSNGRSFNQLFSGDSRFVINGSSLQIRSPSGRNDETLYVCQAVPPANQEPAQLGTESQQQLEAHYSAGMTLPSRQSSLAAFPGPSKQVGAGVHQSSSASSISPCASFMLANLFQASDESSPSAKSGHQAGSGQPMMSSISIKIVAKPKIDPFEFSRNLEEGMRAAVACVVISGQSPVDIRWFKDGNLLLPEADSDSADETEVSIDQANGFSSTLTFHRIRPSHSGFYTCIAANAFAATNHTSRLVVNVPPYFIDPPKSAQAILGTNLLVNCRAGGQPSPQIRWRKLMPIGGSSAATNNNLVAPAGGLSLNKGNPSDTLAGEQFQDNFGLQQHQMAPPGGQPPANPGKFEFRVISSNSHIQVLENGSMIINNLELGDASRYVCQAFNGINPSLSEVIDVRVLSPAEFEINYETVSVKRDSMIKFNCAPKGNQPMQIEWRKEGQLLVASSSVAGQQQHQQQLFEASASGRTLSQSGKYSEIVHYAPLMANQSAGSTASAEPEQVRQRHHSLVVAPAGQMPANQTEINPNEAVRSSELFINYADRSDTGNFVCLAKNNYGKDELTYRLIVQEVPDAPPNLSVQSVQANSVKLVWSAPFDGNLPIGHFVIEYRKASNNHHQVSEQASAPGGQHSEWARLVTSTNKLDSSSVLNSNGDQLQSTSGTQFSVVLRQLSAKTTYHVRVAAVNAIGQGGFSPHLTMSTAEEPPSSRPNDLRCQPVSSSAIKVLWRGPVLVDEQAPVRGYYVSHRKLQPVSTGNSASTNRSSAEGSGLASAQSWLATVSLSALNSTDGRSPDDGAFMVGSQQQFELSSGAGSPRKGLLLPPGGGANYELLVAQLEKNTKYEFRVQPYNSIGLGPASEAIGQTLKYDRPGQPILKLVSTRKQSFELKWTIGDDQPLMGFSLFYKCEYDDWQEIQLGIIHHYVIENLRCGNKYQIYLSAFNGVGRSDPSEVLSVRTEGTVPIAPDKSQFIKSNITEVVLDMSSWQSGGCPISSFMIQFKRLHESNWFVLSEGQSPFASSYKVPIGDLAPASWYKLLVTAANEAGTTNAQYLFSTLTTSGEEVRPNFGEHELASMDQNRSHQTGWLTASNGGLSLWNRLVQMVFGLGKQQEQAGGAQLLLPVGCIVFILVSLLLSYLYYSHSGSAGSPSSTSGSSETSSNAQRSLGHHHHQKLVLGSNGYHSGQHANGTMSVLGRSPSVVMNRLQNCASATTTTLNRAGNPARSDEKQLIQGNNYNHLMSFREQDSQQQPHSCQDGQMDNNAMIDTLIGSAGLQAFMSGAGQNQATSFGQPVNNNGGMVQLGSDEQGSHNLTLLSSANNLFVGTPSHSLGGQTCAGSSSVSTNTTNCLDGSSSQTSSSGTSAGFGGCGAKAKLQLIDESSMIDEAQELQGNQLNWPQYPQCLYGDQNSPSRLLYSGFAPAVNDQSLANEQQAFGQPLNGSMSTNHRYNANLMTSIDDTGAGRHVYDPNQANQRLLSSASFASAADLVQRQQLNLYHQQSEHSSEPVYQRLDKFQSFNLPICKQQSSVYSNQAIKSQTLRFNKHNNTRASIKSTTLQRAPVQLHQQHQLEQQQQKHYLYEQNDTGNPGLCFQQQQQQQHLTQQLVDNYHEQVCQVGTSEIDHNQQQHSSVCHGPRNC